MDNIVPGVDGAFFPQLLEMEEGSMTLTARIAGLSCLVATAFLLDACQQNAGSRPGEAFSHQEKAAFADQSAWEKRHCCRRGGRNGGGSLK